MKQKDRHEEYLTAKKSVLEVMEMLQNPKYTLVDIEKKIEGVRRY